MHGPLDAATASDRTLGQPIRLAVRWMIWATQVQLPDNESRADVSRLGTMLIAVRG